MKPLIKLHLLELDTIVIVPTVEGLEYIKSRPEAFKLVSEKLPPAGIQMTVGERKIGGAAVLTYEAKLDGQIMNVTVNQNTVLNYYKMHIFTGTSYFLNLPFTIEKTV